MSLLVGGVVDVETTSWKHFIHFLSEKLKISYVCNIHFFKGLHHHVSMFAMKQLYKQYEMIKFRTMVPMCSGHFTASMGLPCAHTMIKLKD